MLWIRDSDALEKLIEWYRPLLREIAEGMLGKTLAAKVDASDIVQETLDGVSSGFKNHNLQNRREWKGYLRRALARRVADVRQQTNHFCFNRIRMTSVVMISLSSIRRVFSDCPVPFPC
jgi:DNA-directed RNA polymerase specialized sigma24 family protein